MNSDSLPWSHIASTMDKPTVVDNVSTVVDGVKHVHRGGDEAIAAREGKAMNNRQERTWLVRSPKKGGPNRRGQASQLRAERTSATSTTQIIWACEPPMRAAR